MADHRDEQIMIDLDADTRYRLLAAAEVEGVDVSSYCLHVLEREVARDDQQPEEQAGKPYDFDSLFAFRDALLGDRRFPGDSVDLIREARDNRTAQTEGP